MMARLAAPVGLLLLLGSPCVARTAIGHSGARIGGEAPGLRSPANDAARNLGTAARVAAAYGTISSMFRTVAHNRAVGGVDNSYHLQGRAIDVVRRPGVLHIQLQTALQRAGLRLIESLDEGDHSHFAFAAAPVPPMNVVTPMGIASSGAVEAPAPTAAPSVAPRLAADEHGTLEVTGDPNVRLAEASVGRR